MSGHEILIVIMAIFALLGGLDRIWGNRFGLGKEFEEGILAMGSLALAMIGVITLAPVLAAVLKPVVVPPLCKVLFIVQISRGAVIPSGMKWSRGIYAFGLHLQSNRCQDPSTRFARSG